jgi:hypothetical protein
MLTRERGGRDVLIAVMGVIERCETFSGADHPGCGLL